MDFICIVNVPATYWKEQNMLKDQDSLKGYVWSVLVLYSSLWAFNGYFSI